MPIAILSKLFAKKDHNDLPHRIYGTVVAQARNSALYTDFAIPDTVLGRYDMLAMHVFLLNFRLKHHGSHEKTRCSELSQNVFDLFMIDLERGLRDIGYADTSVHKRKKRLARSYFALIEEIDQPLELALENGRIDGIVPAITKRYFDKIAKQDQNSCGQLLANYILNVAQTHSTQSNQAILSGILNWPEFAASQDENKTDD